MTPCVCFVVEIRKGHKCPKKGAMGKAQRATTVFCVKSQLQQQPLDCYETGRPFAEARTKNADKTRPPITTPASICRTIARPDTLRLGAVVKLVHHPSLGIDLRIVIPCRARSKNQFSSSFLDAGRRPIAATNNGCSNIQFSSFVEKNPCPHVT